MITENELNYLKELQWRKDHIKGEFEKAVFGIVCQRFWLYKKGTIASKKVSKEFIVERLVQKGLLNKKADGSLPDDRKVRAVARELLKAGLPIVATSQNKGYYIAEKPYEIDLPQRQNSNRAKKLLDVDKGYNEVRNLLMGQGRLFL